MIFGFDHLRGRDRKLRVDAVVIGSGAGGASAARELAARGATVIVLEAGSFVPPSDCTQLEHEMFPRLYHDAAGRTTRDRAVHVHQGKGVGGSTLHNLCLCARIPPAAVFFDSLSSAGMMPSFGKFVSRLSLI